MHRFHDIDPGHRPLGMLSILRFMFLDRLLGRRKPSPAGPPAPRIEVDRGRLEDPSAAQVLWLGHASFLLQMGGSTILVDPNLGGYLCPIKRYLEPALTVQELPPIDLLLVTHNHRDHLDAGTVRRLDRRTPVITPLGLGRFFERRGFGDVTELEWWQQTEPRGLRVTLVPARHWSRRGPFDLNKSLWGGYVVEAGEHTVYHAGDSSAWDRFAEIGERFPDIDLALMPIGAYEPGWFMENSHMTPEQAGQAFLEVGARRLLPMHWGSYKLSDEPLVEPIERLRTWWRKQAPDGRLEDVPVGGFVDLVV